MLLDFIAYSGVISVFAIPRDKPKNSLATAILSNVCVLTPVNVFLVIGFKKNVFIAKVHTIASVPILKSFLFL